MSTKPTKTVKNPWSTGEKALLWTIILVIAAVGICALWAERNSVIPAIAIPTPPMPPRNAYDYFVAASNAEVQGRAMSYAEAGPGVGGTAPWPTYTQAQKATLVRANAPMFRLLRQGLALPYQPPMARSFNAPMVDYSGFREVARDLVLNARVQEAQGDWNGAAQTSLDAMQEGEKIAHGGDTLGLLVGIACQAIGRKAAWGTVFQLTPQQAEAAARRLEAINADEEPLVNNVQEQKWSDEASLLAIMHAPDWRQQLLSDNTIGGGSGTESSVARTAASARSLLISPRQVLADYASITDGEIRSAQAPYSAHPALPVVPDDPLVQAFAQLDFHDVRVKAAYTDAEDRLLTVTLALRAYQGDHHGAYPQTLSQLVPRYLTRVPDDPFAVSGPLRYRNHGLTYLLYSVGPDGIDNGGKPSTMRYVDQDSTGDIVSGVNL